jgi:hypothetical protein
MGVKNRETWAPRLAPEVPKKPKPTRKPKPEKEKVDNGD